LFDALKAEDAGILAYIVEGAVAYFAEGLEPPEVVKAHTLRYFATQDPLERFLTNFERCDPKAGTRASMLFEMFERWCWQECEEHSHSETSFGRSLKESRHRLESRKVGGYIHYGLRATADLFEGDGGEL
jgi:putative DNA primase/helicase